MVIRNPKHTRPWQHVFEYLIIYILIAEKIFKKNIYNGAYNVSSFNLNFKVEDVINTKNYVFTKIKINKNTKYYESEN